MKINLIKKLLLLSLLLWVSTTSISCAKSDKQTVISKNVSMEANQDENLIQKDIETGNNYLQQGKYGDAKQSYEKAITLDKGIKQTYLTIKDKYLEKGRLDDAYYIIKSAIKNDVDIANMNTILAQISGRFEITNISEHLKQNNKYKLPDDVIMKINGIDTKILVNWNNSSEINTSKVGEFIYEGNSEQYGRKVKLELYLTAPVVNKPNEISTTNQSQGNKTSTTNQPQAEKKQLKPLEKDDFVISYKDVQLDVGEDASKVLQQLGPGTANEDNNFGFVGWDMENNYKFFMHAYPPNASTFTLYTKVSIANGTSIISELTLNDLGTKRGLSKGDLYNKMIELYGEPTQELQYNTGSKYSYIFGKRELDLYFDSNKAISAIVIVNTSISAN